jgi:hypothetical protein
VADTDGAQYWQGLLGLICEPTKHAPSMKQPPAETLVSHVSLYSLQLDAWQPAPPPHERGTPTHWPESLQVSFVVQNCPSEHEAPVPLPVQPEDEADGLQT